MTGRRAPRLRHIEVRQASVQLGRHWALRDVDFDVRSGERWLLLGPNGAGKTVLLKLLRGDVWPTPTGREQLRWHFGDGDSHAQPDDAFARIAYLGPERQDRYERYESTLDVRRVVLTGFDDSDFPLAPATTAQRRRIAEVLGGVGLAGLAERRFRTLSYGQRRRVLLARAIVRRPDVLLLDEALNGLDARGRVAFLRALQRVTDARTAWVLSSHRSTDLHLAGITHVARIAGGSVVTESIRAADPGASRKNAVNTSLWAPASTSMSRTVFRNAPGPKAPTRVATQVAQRGDNPRPLLHLEAAAVYREGRLVVGAFDWSLRPGEHWYVYGPNGAGKSTLMATLYGDLWPALGGTLHRASPDVTDWKRGTGLVSPELQASYAATGCTVEEIVTSGLHDSIGLNEYPTAAERVRVRRALREWQLDELAARHARALSYGQLRTVLAARAFIRPRRLYLLDEPFDGLDEHARLRVRRLLDAAVKKGATVVIASHHADDVPAYVHRALRLRRGRPPVAEAWPRYESGTAAS